MSDLTSPSEIRTIMRRYNFRTRKSLGQNFLADGNIVKKIASAAQIASGDLVVEIGPGLGTLTRELAAGAQRVVCVEVDEALLPILRETLDDLDNVSLIHGDAMKVDFDRIAASASEGLWGHGAKKYKLAANLPYYITTPLLMRLLTENFNLDLLVIMIQLEVAARLTASPGSKDYGALSVAVQYYTVPELVFRVPASVFIPRPEVDSAVVRLTRRDKPAVAIPDEKLFFKLVKGAFGQRRKTLLNALSGAGLGLNKSVWEEVLRDAGIDPVRRGETLSLEEFAALTRTCWERI